MLLKNCVFARINEIREIKKRPKLGDILKYFKKSGLTSEQISNKLTMLFSNEPRRLNDEDKKFDWLNAEFEGMKKSLQINLETLNEIDKKINQLQNRRDIR